jgi:Fic family protein
LRAELFGPNSTGTLVPIRMGSATHAFVPNPLPPTWDWPACRWPLLLDAHKALATLSGTGKHLPAPTLIMRPLQTREAVRSSSLEGTYTEPHQQALFDLEPDLESESDRTSAQREVFNYAEALRLRQRSRESLPLSLRLIRDLHRVLMTGVRGGDKNPGQFRTYQNQIGKPPRFVPAPPEHLSGLLDAFEKYLHAPRAFDPLVDAFFVHYQFEAIHPFMDGNGRVGRVLLSILIEEWCGLSGQWLYMSPFFEANKDTYMERLLRLSTDGDWEGWASFCLHGVIEQAVDTQRRCDKLLALHAEYRRRAQGIVGRPRLLRIVDALFETPVARVAHTAARLNVSYPTARSDLRRLAAAEIVRELPGATPIAYYSPEILDVIYED